MCPMFSPRNIGRLVFVVVVWAVAIAAVQARLVGLQVISSAKLRQRAKRQQQKLRDIPARRGTIYDRNGKPLAVDNLFYDIYGDPSQIDDPDLVDSVLCGIFGRPRGYYRKRILDAAGRFFVYLELKVDVPHAMRVRAKNLEGVHMTPIYNRFYPYGSTASTVIGYVGHDGRGRGGLELFYDKQLAGKPAQRLIFTDACGRTYPLLHYSLGNPVPGSDIYLTIDIRLQQILEAELKDALSRHCADGACGVFLDPRTGEVLAMASVPNFDPNDYSSYPLQLHRNRTITDPFEPGSIFKLVTMAAALCEGLITPFDTVDCERGRAFICGRVVRDVHGMGKVPAREVIVHSSNVGITKIAQLLEKRTFYEYIRRFGFGTCTGIDLPGESGGILRPPARWSKTTMATLPMGYEISATPLQIACAYAAVANRGKLMKPFVVSKVVRYDGRVVWRREPMAVRQVIPQEVADTLGAMFRDVVLHGTATLANSRAIPIAGKTGTAHKHKRGARGYEENAYFASFVGYAPYGDPVVVGFVMVDNPRRGHYYGGVVAAPVLRAVLEKAVSSGIIVLPAERSVALAGGRGDSGAVVPDIRRMTPQQAEVLLARCGLEVQFRGVGKVICDQSPAPGRRLERGSVVIAYLAPLAPRCKDSVVVPDVVGLSLRRAAEKLARAGVRFVVHGHGIVVEQVPKAESVVDTAAVCVLLCEPKGEGWRRLSTN